MYGEAMANGNGKKNGNGKFSEVQPEVGYAAGVDRDPPGAYTGIKEYRKKGWETSLAPGGLEYRYYPSTKKTYRMGGGRGSEVTAGRPLAPRGGS
jgi:hypothetical protein